MNKKLIFRCAKYFLVTAFASAFIYFMIGWRMNHHWYRNAWWSINHPRAASMILMYLDLRNFASDHNGNFPSCETNQYIALQMLFPDYSSESELAGLTGDIERLKQSLKTGKRLNKETCSWNYVSGLNENDNPELAILWENTSGVFPDGGKDRSGGHAVIFLSGRKKQISSIEWPKFIIEQEKLRAEVFRNKKIEETQKLNPVN